MLIENRITFESILRRTLNIKTNSRPPKMELTGILIPCHQEHRGTLCKFKLGTESSEYFLAMDEHIMTMAKRASWDEVAVKGHLNIDDGTFEVDKIILKQNEEVAQESSGIKESFVDVEVYKRIIDQRGKLEPALDYLAS